MIYISLRYTLYLTTNSLRASQLCFRGRMNFMGYLNNVEKTKETLDDESWLHTGDVGKVDEVIINKLITE